MYEFRVFESNTISARGAALRESFCCGVAGTCVAFAVLENDFFSSRTPLPPMPQIRILPDRVANQIAAGEVVERPMSVIKELLENSLDANATRITIEFRNGGKSFIAVHDNGCGMSPDQALLALERHATSKICETADLDTIHTFGFRGEALPSIASVSHFVLRTRPAGADCGAEILVEGGKYRFCREVGMPTGTSIEVSRLFSNVPARLKFLKTENTEAAHITRCVRLYAVAHPEIAFTLRENGREIFRSPAGTDLRERVAAIWGRQLAADLIPLNECASGGMRVFGAVGKPGVSRASRTELVTIVNGRPVDNRTMAYALVESYHTLIPRGRYPLAFLFLEIDPHAVDVNVHPAKREVRFRNEAAVRNLIISAVLKTVGGAEVFPAEALATPPRAANFIADANATTIPTNATTIPTGATTIPTNAGNSFPQNAPQRPISPFPQNASFPQNAPDGTNAAAPCGLTGTSAANANATNSGTGAFAAGATNFSAWQLIAPLGFDGLLLFRAENALLVFNPRLALERIWYERTLARFRNAERVSQALLIPEPIEFDPVLADALLQNLQLLADAGFGIEEFGRNFFRVFEVPDWLSLKTDIRAFVRDIVDRLARVPAGVSRERIAHDALARAAAAQAIQSSIESGKSGVPAALLNELFSTSQPNVSPSGRKIFFEISRAEIARRFS